MDYSFNYLGEKKDWGGERVMWIVALLLQETRSKTFQEDSVKTSFTVAYVFYLQAKLLQPSE